VKTRIWTAITVYVLVAMVRKRLGLNLELHTMLQILSLALFEKIPLIQSACANRPAIRGTRCR